MLLDTDVLIDLALDRRPHADAASELLDRIEQGARNAFHRLAYRFELLLSGLAIARKQGCARLP